MAMHANRIVTLLRKTVVPGKFLTCICPMAVMHICTSAPIREPGVTLDTFCRAKNDPPVTKKSAAGLSWGVDGARTARRDNKK